MSKRAENQASYTESFSSRTVLLAGAVPELNPEQHLKLSEMAKNVLISRFTLFGELVPNLLETNFSVDWRFGKYWEPRYFKNYQFYEQKEESYDVKFPWELSRLHYLIPVMAWRLLGGGDTATLNWILEILRRWRRSNPLAYSVNWYPMEASMRAINLVFLLDLLKIMKSSKSDQGDENILFEMECLLLTMIREHGDFVWNNREFTDVRGNHFTANLVALLLASQALVTQGKMPRQWKRYTDVWLEKEALLQFCADGVNFEKSCGYHKLVLELFVLSGIVRDRMGKFFSKEVQQRLANAARFSDAITRPDKLTANFGDNDDAIVLPFIFHQPRSHGAVIELVRAWLNQPIGTQVFADEKRLAALFLLGRVGPKESEMPEPKTSVFPVGGYTIVRNTSNGFFCMVDVGEVGMAGRGGHGHNDLLAFELCVDGVSMVIDPGCSGYTANLAEKSLYRSTAAHSTVQLYGDEMARLAGHWRIHNDAKPIGVSVNSNKKGAHIRAGHKGYGRFAAGNLISRHIEIDALQQSLVITDEITSPEEAVSACWHFPVGELQVALKDKSAMLLGGGSALVEIDASLPLEFSSAPFSIGYGQQAIGSVIVANATLEMGVNVYHFNIKKKSTL